MVRLAAPWRRVALGSERMMNELQWTMSPTLRQAAADIAARGQGLACIGWNGDVRGVFAFDEEIRPEANAALGSLRDDGWQVLVLTGDHRGRGDQLARQLGVEVRAELLPEEKVHEVGRLRRQTGSVVMVGDGLNDAPALAAADVGVAMGCGADVTREAAGVCLLSNDLSRIRWAVLVARQAMRTVRQNLFWAFAYNTVGIVLAAVGWLNPILAAVAMVGSSLFVIGNSLKSGAAISTPTGAAHVQPQAQPQAVELL